MLKGQPSRTALRVAMRRAAHQLLDVPPVFEDSLAIDILGPERAAELRRDPRAHEKGPLASYLRAFLAARSRLAEDTLADCMAHGVRQYVILGAGLDTFAYRPRRDPLPLRVFEVDHPTTQEWKRGMLATAGIAIPGDLVYVPIDFTREHLGPRLEQSGFDRDAGAMFSWLGVTPYLEPDAVMATLAEVSAMSREGGGVVFDYALPRRTLTLPRKVVFDLVAMRVRAAGEPWIGFFEPAALVAALRDLGFAEVESWDESTINRRYFMERADHLRVGALARLIVARHPRLTGS
jgi:methyltransferase (TIGR00027 family)